MKFTAQEEYGLRCLLQIGREGLGGSLTIPEIALRESISIPYVAKLVRLLRQDWSDEMVLHAVHQLPPKLLFDRNGLACWIEYVPIQVRLWHTFIVRHIICGRG